MRKVLLISIVLISIISFEGKTQELISPIPNFETVPVLGNFLSPNSGGLAVYGDAPSSRYTGAAPIEIPLYVIDTKQSKIPITLSYNASGVRLDQHPGWVGVNWTLSTGGVISRVVNGLPDECVFVTGEETQTDYAGYYYNREKYLCDENITESLNSVKSYMDEVYDYSLPSPLSLNDFELYLILLENGELSKINPKFFTGVFDLEPDEFKFSLPGCSGSFYLNEFGHWQVKCDQTVEVSFIQDGFRDIPSNLSKPLKNNIGYTAQYKTFPGFIIKTNDGTQYYFGEDTNAIEYSINFFAQDKSFWNADSWYLSKIITPNGETIKFTYERDENYISQLYWNYKNTAPYTIDGQTCDRCFQTTITEIRSNPLLVNEDYPVDYKIDTITTPLSISIGIRDHKEGFLVSPVYLKKIETPDSRISFQRSISNELSYPHWIYLPKNGSSEHLYQNKFTKKNIGNNDTIYYHQVLQYKSYGKLSFLEGLGKLKWNKLDAIKIENLKGEQIDNFKFTYNNKPNQRLFLLGVEQQGQTEGKSRTYGFKYNDIGKLPAYFSFETDYWGYYNGKNHDNENIIFDSEIRYYVDSTKLTYGMLSDITFPTGGVRRFSYEPHDYMASGVINALSLERKAGGVRIKKIADYEDQTSVIPLTYKEYEYKDSFGKSSGYLATGADFKKQSSEENSLSIPATPTTLPGYSKHLNNHVTYSVVTEKEADGSYSKYYYTNSDKDHGDIECLAEYHSDKWYIPLPYISKSLERGKLIKQEDFTNNNKLVKKREIKYSRYNSDCKEWEPSYYDIYGPHLEIGEFVRAVRINMIPCSQITRDIWISTKGGVIVSKRIDTRYRTNYIEMAAAYLIYTYSYLPSYEKEVLYNPSTGQEMQTTETEYRYNKYKLLTAANTIDTYKSGSSTIKDSITTELRYVGDIVSSETSSNMVYKKMFDNYMMGYPIEKITSKNGKVITSQLNTYKLSGNNPVFDKEYSLETLSPISNYTKAYMNPTGNFKSDSRLSPRLNYNTYDNYGNIVYTIKDDTEKLVTLWSYGGRYLIAEITNATFSQVADLLNGYIPGSGTSSSDFLENISADIDPKVDDIGNTLRLGLPNSMVTTYKYKPLIGKIEETNARGIKTYYQYDNMGNLSEVYYFENNDPSKKRKVQSVYNHYRNQ
ncbi:hypothetical protein M2132_002230 [Dysgonomonas sp. PH5-45]|uniref:hypothetical protein n=1 Tax=unclassified Dysgonomonas TaxID=2630389 RepID=UPI0024750447|nr:MULTISPECIES: hypothetical protein [unclassified Dysgonomonas]MDH6355880.1 hypothetical protein [Dysgonomonas sp. PH5-45]MDH6388775.1 hypothetical protein [Dysgonomonas sp. PH5-37]